MYKWNEKHRIRNCIVTKCKSSINQANCIHGWKQLSVRGCQGGTMRSTDRRQKSVPCLNQGMPNIRIFKYIPIYSNVNIFLTPSLTLRRIFWKTILINSLGPFRPRVMVLRAFKRIFSNCLALNISSCCDKQPHWCFLCRSDADCATDVLKDLLAQIYVCPARQQWKQ